ncbi:MAG: MBL fold metallo-hydrolase [Solirubrobacteraceae bacterium]|nr:MBL fold metallo-hydrolase [Solirubrobacteraceae bacterium]
MPSPATERQQPRGERIIPGLWRLRLPLPWSGIPHCNAWVIDAPGGDGHVMFDCGLHSKDSFAQLVDALAQIGKRMEDTKLLVCTHAHVDHYGEAKSVVDASGCELWMHPRHEHMTASLKDPERLLEQRVAVGRESGVPEELLQYYREAGQTTEPGVAGLVTPDRDLVEGVRVETAVGTWVAIETPGHAPSHVSLFQPDRRILLAGDHVLGRVALYYDYGWTEDPVAEYLNSCDKVDALDARLCLPGHGKSFTDVRGHVEAHREAALGRLDRVEDVVRSTGPATAIEMIPEIYGRPLNKDNAGWLISETMCYLRHLERRGVISAGDDAGHPRWSAVPRQAPEAV